VQGPPSSLIIFILPNIFDLIQGHMKSEGA
jgi:hypothetical protein